MIKLSNILSELEIDSGDIDLAGFTELSYKNRKEVLELISLGKMKEVYKDGKLHIYTHRAFEGYGGSNNFEILYIYKEKIYRRHLNVPNYRVHDLNNEEKVEYVKDYDMWVKINPLPDYIYQEVIKYKDKIDND